MSLRASKAAGWSAMILMVIVIIVAICTHVVSSIWEYITIFLGFMSVFCHLMSLLLIGMSRSASRKLDVSAGIFGILAVVALIVVFILDWV